jgi:hypothetical protein
LRNYKLVYLFLLVLLCIPAKELLAQSSGSLPEVPQPAIATRAGGVLPENGDVSVPNSEADSSSRDAWLEESLPGGTMQGAAVGGDSAPMKYKPYHWSGLMWQSLAFNGVEDIYRLSTDPYMRYLIADGPYWHNYIASMEQWNMRRWNDGDDFLVDYIGHPMQGAVSGFIEIQNSDRQKYLRINMSKEYWRSRYHALLWATVFSTQQKIGPLGEAALGNAGGYTYALHCPYPCKYVPGVTKYTNNTGWTDFITTPVIGTLWTAMEDFIDLEVSDRLENKYPGRLAPKIVRGALNPTRTMANAFRGKNPWYRDYKHKPDLTAQSQLPEEGRGARAAEASGQDEWSKYRFELFPHVDAISLPVNTASCSHCRNILYGPGMGFAAGLARYLDFDADFASHSDASPLPSDRAGGSILMGTFGFRSGLVWKRAAVRAAIRPGFLTYDKAYLTSPAKNGPTPEIGRITHFITALAVSGDARISPRFAARFVIANDPVRYRSPKLTQPRPGQPPYLTWLSREIFITNENWSWQTGMVVRF